MTYAIPIMSFLDREVGKTDDFILISAAVGRYRNEFCIPLAECKKFRYLRLQNAENFDICRLQNAENSDICCLQNAENSDICCLQNAENYVPK